MTTDKLFTMRFDHRVFLFLMILATEFNVWMTPVAMTMKMYAKASSPIAFCGDCWCIPNPGEECPYDDMPLIEFSDEWLTNLQTMTLENPMQLSCDIYNDDNCDTWPPLELDGEVCAAEIIPPSTDASMTCPQGYSYRLKTVASRFEAEQNLLLITHEGHCGTCSSFQDLSVYMSSQDLVSVGVNCAVKAISNFTAGLECYKDAGFSDPCATTWLYNSLNTNAFCLQPCGSHLFSSAANNLDPPGCELADCIACDEEFSGPLFQKFAGRTRRRSGLLSAIVRPCADVGNVRLLDPCDYDTLTAPPTMTPTTMVPSVSPTDEEETDEEGSSGSGLVRYNDMVYYIGLLLALLPLAM